MPKKESTRPLTKEEIDELPHWAIVAFAARCARRVGPLFASAWPDAPEKHKQAVARAAQVAEQRAAGGTQAEAYVTYAAADAATAADAADAFAAGAAADAAAYAARAAVARSGYATISYAARAAYAAAYGAAYAANIRMDLKKLKQAAKNEKWTDETPVPPEFFGPLWPEGEPDWKVIIADRKIRATTDRPPSFYQKEPIELYIEPGNASKETIQEVLEALSDLHIAAGGLGLIFKHDGHYVSAHKEVTV